MSIVTRRLLVNGTITELQRACTNRKTPVSDVLRHLGWTLQAPEGGGAVRERWEALTALIELADQAPAGTTLVEFVADLLERQTAQHEGIESVSQ